MPEPSHFAIVLGLSEITSTIAWDVSSASWQCSWQQGLCENNLLHEVAGFYIDSQFDIYSLSLNI